MIIHDAGRKLVAPRDGDWPGVATVVIVIA